MNLLAKLSPYSTKVIPYLVGISAFSIFLLWAHHHVYQQGVKDTEAVYAKNQKKIDDKTNKKIADEQDKFKKTKEGLEKTIAQMASDYEKENDHVQTKINALNADILSSRRRLSIPTTGCKNGLSTKDSSPSVAAKSGAEERSELVPQTAIDLIRIAAEGDTGLRERNECIDRYNEVMKAVNSQ